MKKALFLLMIPMCLFAQKRSEHIFDGQDIESIQIDSDFIFKIAIQARPVNEIQINTIVDGETYASTFVHFETNENRLEINTGRTPDFIPFNDKLSAHKVISIELELTIPEGLDISVHSTLAEVRLKGSYDALQMNLGRGGFLGKGIRFRESAINTISGNVQLTLREANVTATSRNGSTQVDPIFNKGPSCSIQSIHGDITVVQVK